MNEPYVGCTRKNKERKKMEANKIKKTFRLSDQVIQKIEEIKQSKNYENNQNGSPELNATDIVSEAISFYHSHLFGKDVMDSTIQKLEVIISSAVNLTLRNYVEDFANALNHLNMNDEKMIESMFIMMRANGLILEDHRALMDMVFQNEEYHSLMDQVISIKNKK